MHHRAGWWAQGLLLPSYSVEGLQQDPGSMASSLNVGMKSEWGPEHGQTRGQAQWTGQCLHRTEKMGGGHVIQFTLPKITSKVWHLIRTTEGSNRTAVSKGKQWQHYKSIQKYNSIGHHLKWFLSVLKHILMSTWLRSISFLTKSMCLMESRWK